jgi:hypothetical protein
MSSRKGPSFQAAWASRIGTSCSRDDVLAAGGTNCEDDVGWSSISSMGRYLRVVLGWARAETC